MHFTVIANARCSVVARNPGMAAPGGSGGGDTTLNVELLRRLSTVMDYGYGPRIGRNRGKAVAGAGGGSGDTTVNVELLARSLERKQEGAAFDEQHRATASTHHISRVPVHLRDNYADAYTPGLVAIGPLHNRENRRLRAAERLKERYLNGLISRGHPDPAYHLTVIQDYVRIVATREQEARAMYVAEEVADIAADDFIKMMVLDGCFIIEHLVNVFTGRNEPSLHWTPFGPRQLSVDLVLAKNQIPFFILVDLITASKLPEFETIGYAPPALLVKLVLFYLAGEKGRDMSDDALPAADGVSHILHLLHEMITAARTRWERRTRAIPLLQGIRRLLCRLPSLLTVPLLRRFLPEGLRRRTWWDYVPSASDLKRMRVQIKRARGSGIPVVGIAAVMGPVPLSVRLHEDQLHLPQLWLEYRTAPLLLNLMAFEQSSQGGSHSMPQDVSSYVAFMEKLVHSAEDVRLLVEAEVLLQQPGGLGNESMEQIARFFRVAGAASAATGNLDLSYLHLTLDLLRSRSDRVDQDRKYFTFLAEFLTLVTFISGVSTVIQTYAAFKYH